MCLFMNVRLDVSLLPFPRVLLIANHAAALFVLSPTQPSTAGY